MKTNIHACLTLPCPVCEKIKNYKSKSEMKRVEAIVESETKPKGIWILRTPGGDILEYDEPTNQNWNLCSKTYFIEYSVYEKLTIELFEMTKQRDAWKDVAEQRAKNYETVNTELEKYKTKHEYKMSETRRLREQVADYFQSSEVYRTQVNELKVELETTKEIISYLPKVPTQPYEKELAKKLQKVENFLELLNINLTEQPNYMTGYFEALRDLKRILDETSDT